MLTGPRFDLYSVYMSKPRTNAQKAAAVERVKKWAIKNPERVKTNKQRWATRNAAEIREYTHTYYIDHKQSLIENKRRWRAENKAIFMAQCARYRKAHPEKSRERCSRRRARIHNATIEPVNYIDVLARDGRWCYLCEKDITLTDEMHFDHVIPLSKGGAHTMENIRPTHGTCNVRKHSKILEVKHA